jgi:putative oxidoreductase
MARSPEVDMSRQLLDTVLGSDQFNIVMLVLRLVAGPTIFWHGFNKMFRGGRIDGTAGWFDSMGMRPNGRIHAYVASLTEMGSGILLTVGLLTPFAAAGVIGIMVVAGWTVHRHAFLVIKEGFEFVLVLGALCWGIGALGPGRYSLDHAFGILPDLTADWRGAAIAAGLGIGAGVLTLVACYRPPASDGS